MTHPNREELAGLVEDRIGQDFDGECHLTEEEARQIAAALRQSPTVEEVAREDGRTYYGQDCPVGMVQVEFVGCPPGERYSDYGWKPVNSAFIELYVDGQRYRIDAGDIGPNCFDGKPRRGIHINYPMSAKIGDRSLNACNIAHSGEPFWRPSDDPTDQKAPTVEQIMAVLEDTIDAELAGPCENRAEIVADSLTAAAQAIDTLYKRGGG